MFGKLGEAWALMSMFLGLTPMIRQVVTALEVPGHGVEKAEAVIQLVRAAWELVPDELKPKLGLDKVEAYVKTAIAVIVRLLNASGEFSRQVK